jgi:hypothetical protein
MLMPRAATNTLPLLLLPLLLLQVPRPSFYTASMSGVVGSQLGQFGHKPEVLGELLAGERFYCNLMCSFVASLLYKWFCDVCGMVLRRVWWAHNWDSLGANQECWKSCLRVC